MKNSAAIYPQHMLVISFSESFSSIFGSLGVALKIFISVSFPCTRIKKLWKRKGKKPRWQNRHSNSVKKEVFNFLPNSSSPSWSSIKPTETPKSMHFLLCAFDFICFVRFPWDKKKIKITCSVSTQTSTNLNKAPSLLQVHLYQPYNLISHLLEPCPSMQAVKGYSTFSILHATSSLSIFQEVFYCDKIEEDGNSTWWCILYWCKRSLLCSWWCIKRGDSVFKVMLTENYHMKPKFVSCSSSSIWWILFLV